jgi:O-antigen ligase
MLDLLTGHRLQSMVTGNASHALTKYNRGVDYLVIVIWPILAYCRQRREPVKAMSLVVVVAVVLLVGESSTARLAALLAAGALVLATYWPRLVKNGLPIMVAVLAMSLPFLLRVLSKDRSLLAPYIKNSGLDRLEIWDYMSARVLEKPFFGWGLWSARSVPIRPDELSQYVWARGNFPHNHWLQLWVEIGVCGVVMAVLFVWTVLARMQRMTDSLLPFAYANVVAALTISVLNFEFTTDSWWAALAAAAFLWTALGRLDSGPAAEPTGRT